MSSPGAAHPVSARFADRLRIRARDEEVPVADRVTFPELVWAHFLREQELSHGHLHGQAAEDYRLQLERFVKEHGCLVNAYWCTSEASAVALTEKPGTRVGGFLWRRPPNMRFHSATDWVTKDSPDIAHQLHTGETLAIRVSEVLSETSERIAMQWILSVSGYLLGIVDKAEGKPSQHETSVAVKRSRTELAKVEGYYDRAGEKSGRLEYFKGMMLGVIALGVLAVAGAAVWSLIADFHLKDDNTQTFFACYAMGAIGAMVSVMARMASSKEDAFNLDYEVGRRSIRRVGSFRPVIGAIFAVVLYLALRGGLIQLQTTSGGNDTTFFYAALAFIAGFSERRTQILLGGAERVLSDGEEHAEEKETAPKEVTRRRKQAATTGSTG
jgi:hypothetical protein